MFHRPGKRGVGLRCAPNSDLRWRGLVCGACVVVLAIAALALLPTRSEAQQAGTQPRAPAALVTSLSCDLEMTFYRDGRVSATVGAHCLLVPPDRARLEVRWRLPAVGAALSDFFKERVGTVFLRHGSELGVYNPFTDAFVRFPLAGATVPPPLSNVHGTGEVVELDGYAPAMAALSDPSRQEWRLQGQEAVGDHMCDVLEWRPNAPLKVREPHVLTRFRTWVETERRCPVKSVAFDNGEQPVVTTSFLEPTEVAPGRWVCLRSETAIAPGDVPVAHEVIIGEHKIGEPGGRREVWHATVAMKGRKKVVTYQWHEQGVLLPKSVDVSEEDGALLMSCRFSDYQVNVPVDEEVFRLDRPPLPPVE